MGALGERLEDGVRMTLFLLWAFGTVGVSLFGWGLWHVLTDRTEPYDLDETLDTLRRMQQKGRIG